MGERERYEPGTFSWADLNTTDQAAAKEFYGGLFGWEADDQPVDDRGTVYSMMTVGGRAVAAISPQPEAMARTGAPPAWNSYVTVESADASAARAAELGATVAMAPFDIFDAGRMAGILDPQGAFLLLWEPRAHVGAQLVNAPGALMWNELSTSDLDAASAFYADLFGWELKDIRGEPEPYLAIGNAGSSNGGIRRSMPPGLPPQWLVYFAVEDLEAGMGRVRALGGAVHAGPIEVEVGRLAVVGDPQGAIFVIYAGDLDP